MNQNVYLFVILSVKHKKSPFLAVLTSFLILDKIQDGGQDGDHCWWRDRPPATPSRIKYTSSCWEDQRLSTDGKIVSKYCNVSKTVGQGGFHHPASCTTVRVRICVYVQGLSSPPLTRAESNGYNLMAAIVRALWLAAKRAKFSCNDRAKVARPLWPLARRF